MKARRLEPPTKTGGRQAREMRPRAQHPFSWGPVLALVAGALLACGFAPLQWWPLAVLCPAVLMWLWQGAKPREAAWLGFWFNIGTFAAGTYWLYVSIHIFGEAPVYVAAFLMLALVSIMGLYHAVLGYVVARWLPETGAATSLSNESNQRIKDGAYTVSNFSFVNR